MNESTLVTLVPGFLRAVAGALPALVNQMPTASTYFSVAEEVLSAAAILIEHGDAAHNALRSLTAQIEAFGQNDPTEEQWSALKIASDSAHAIIQAPLST